MLKHLAKTLIILGVFLWSASAAYASGLSFDLKRVVTGKNHPAIILRPAEKVKKVTITLTRADGKVTKLVAKNLRPGREKAVKVKQENGQFSYDAEFDIVWANKSRKPSSFETQFTFTRIGKLQVSISAEDINLDERTLRCRSNNPTKKMTLEIFGDGGKLLKTLEEDYDAEAPGNYLEMAWDDPGEDILFMRLRVVDIAGFWNAVRITPFSISIPHDEVEFKSGQHVVRASEAPKLQKTMTHINEALAKHGTLLSLKLFVAGYTDTVGSRASNQGLSTRRARAIAAWFRKNGVRIPIYYQGFGEDVLAKGTPDETEEAANRRALYLLASQKPGATKQTPRQKWQKL
jgi:outer membrane protein OmpA-like peptidoglycan-associated protein